MHFVFLNQYYPPDVAPTGVMLADVAEYLAKKGHQVTVICAAGGYANGQTLEAENKEDNDSKHIQNLIIIRLHASRFGRGTFAGKLADYASYYLGAAWKLLMLQPRPDRVVAMTTPPFLSVLVRFISNLRGADHAHWVMDLYPDVMAAHGIVGEGRLGYQILTGFARWGFGGKRCAALLTLGPDMELRLANYRNGLSPRVSWVPLWGNASDEHREGESRAEVIELRRERGWRDNEMVVMYSGNMGLGHRFGEILAAAERLNIEHRTSDIEHQTQEASGGASASIDNQVSTLRNQLPPNIRFVFYGAGKRRGEIEDFLLKHPDCGLELHDYAPTAMLNTHLRSADLHLVSLDAAWTGTMVPSKLQGIFAAGRPVIFIGSPDSSIAQWVIASGGGWVVNPDDSAGLLAAIEEASNSTDRNLRAKAAWDFAQVHFNKEINVARISELFESAIL